MERSWRKQFPEPHGIEKEMLLLLDLQTDQEEVLDYYGVIDAAKTCLPTQVAANNLTRASVASFNNPDAIIALQFTTPELSKKSSRIEQVQRFVPIADINDGSAQPRDGYSTFQIKIATELLDVVRLFQRVGKLEHITEDLGSIAIKKYLPPTKPINN